MKKRIWILCLCLVLMLPLFSQEDPVSRLKNAGSEKDYPGASHILVFDKTHVKMMDTGLSHVNREYLYKVLTISGARQLKSLTFGYDPGSAFIEIKVAEIIKKDGKRIPLSLKTVSDYPAPARMIYWGAREIILPVGRLEPGDGLLVKTYQKGFTYALLYDNAADSAVDDERYIPPMRGHYYDIVPFYSNIPINCKRYELSIPADKELQFEFYNGEARHFCRLKGKRRHYLWEKTKIMPAKRENRQVDSSNVAPKLLVSTSPDWKAKSLWFHKVNEDFGSFDFDDEIKAKTEEIISGAKTDLEKISRLTHWCAEEIRYSGISMGEGEGFTLHKGAMTFSDRCGVCKDKAGMLITMLRAAGFESYPAMTMAGSRIDKIPADQFNHCVTLVKLEGKYKLLDPTWVPGVRELWSSAEQQQEYLPGIPEGSDLKSTPISPPENHYLNYDIRTTIAKNGTMTAQITIDAEGQSDSGLRRAVSRGYIQGWTDNTKQQLRQIHPAIQIANLKYSNPDDLSKPMRVSCKVTVPNYLLNGQAEYYLAPISSHLPFSRLLSFNRLDTKIKKRKYPFRTRCSQLINVKETIRLQGKQKLAHPVKLEKITGDGADFNGFIKQSGNTITIQKQLKMKKRIYEVKDWKSVKEGVTQFQKPASKLLVLK